MSAVEYAHAAGIDDGGSSDVSHIPCQNQH
jgi:hypothetical protein